MENFTMWTATYGRGLSAALTRIDSALACPKTSTVDRSRVQAHKVQGGRPPRGSEALH